MTASKSKHKPTSEITPAEAVNRLRGLSALIGHHTASVNARKQELVDLVGTDNVAELMSNEPERLSTHGEDLVRLNSKMQLAEMAAQGAEKRVRELLPIADRHIWSLSEKLKGIHEQTRELITRSIRKQIADLGLFEDGDIDRLVYRARPVREQSAFETQFPATFSLDRIFVKDVGSVLAYHVTARDVLTLASRLESGIKQSEARFEQIRKTYR